jgi:hypothetical protein
MSDSSQSHFFPPSTASTRFGWNKRRRSVKKSRPPTARQPACSRFAKRLHTQCSRLYRSLVSPPICPRPPSSRIRSSTRMIGVEPVDGVPPNIDRARPCIQRQQHSIGTETPESYGLLVARVHMLTRCPRSREVSAPRRRLPPQQPTQSRCRQPSEPIGRWRWGRAETFGSPESKS